MRSACDRRAADHDPRPEEPAAEPDSAEALVPSRLRAATVLVEQGQYGRWVEGFGSSGHRLLAKDLEAALASLGLGGGVHAT